MDWQNYLRFVAALVLVLGLIGAMAWVAKRFGLMPRATLPARGRGRRLQVVEVATIDARHRLLLIRREQTEHLLMLGQTGDLLIERNIPPAPATPAVLVERLGAAS